MRIRDRYDWVVFGDHPAALLSGALAARLGLSVLMLPNLAQVSAAANSPIPSSTGRTISKSGQCLDREPNFLLGVGGEGFGESGLLGEAFQALGVARTDQSLFASLGALPQILTPRLRVQLTHDADALRRELIRELGSDGAAKLGLVEAVERGGVSIEAFWRRLPERLTIHPGEKRKSEDPVVFEKLRQKLQKDGLASEKAQTRWFDKKMTASHLAAQSGAPGLQELLKGAWFGLSGGIAEDPRLGSWIHLLCLALHSSRFKGGLSAYRHFLLTQAEKAGAQILGKAELKRIFIEEGQLQGVQISSHGTMITAGGGIAGTALDHLAEKIEANQPKWRKQLKRSPKPVGWRFTLAMTIHQEAITPGMSRRMIWQEVGGLPLEIEWADAEEYDIAEPEHKLLFLRTVLPFTQESLQNSLQKTISARMLRQVTELLPFLEFHIVRVYPDFRSDESELSQAYGFVAPEMIPESLRVWDGSEETRGIGADSGIEGLFVATGESFPELGSMGPTVAAMDAVAWIAHRCGLSGPLAEKKA